MQPVPVAQGHRRLTIDYSWPLYRYYLNYRYFTVSSFIIDLLQLKRALLHLNLQQTNIYLYAN